MKLTSMHSHSLQDDMVKHKNNIINMIDVFVSPGDCELHVPDVQDLVQKMLENLYNAIINHEVRTT